MSRYDSSSEIKLFSVVIQFFIVAALTNLLMAQTPVPAGDVGGVWTFSNSPYMVSGEITVPYEVY